MKKMRGKGWIRSTTMYVLTTALVLQPVVGPSYLAKASVLDSQIQLQADPVGKTDLSDFEIQDGVLIAYKGTADEVFIPEGVTKIAKDALMQKEYSAIHLPVGLQEIDHDAIMLKVQAKVYLPSGWEGGCILHDYWIDREGSSFRTYMYEQAGCSLVIPTDVKNVTEYAPAFTNVIVDVKQGDENTYQDKEWYSFVSEKLNVVETTDFDKNGFAIKDGVLLAYDGPGGDLVIPDTVTEIADNVFMGMDIFDSITVPDSVKKIGKGCFSGLRQKCKTFTIGKGLKEIPDSAFGASTACEKIVIESNIESVGDAAFWGLDYAEIVIPNGIKNVGKNAFAFCNYLPVETLKSVENFGDDIFVGYPNPQYEVLDISNAKSMGQGAFSRVYADVVVLGSDLEVIPMEGLKCGDTINDIVWPKNGKLKELDAYALKLRGDALDTNPIPDTVEILEKRAITQTGMDCNVFYIPASLRVAEEACVPLAKEATIVLPKEWHGACEFSKDALGVTKDAASYNMTLKIPENVVDIEDYLLENECIKNYVITVFPNSTGQYTNREWYKKLIDAGYIPTIEIDQSGSFHVERVDATNEFIMTYTQEYELEESTTLKMTLPDGFSYVADSVDPDMVSDVSVNGNEISVVVKPNKKGAVRFNLKQDKIFKQSEQIVTAEAKLGKAEDIAVNYKAIIADLNANVAGKKAYITVQSMAREPLEIMVNGTKYSAKTDNWGKCYVSYPLEEGKNEIRVSVAGMELDKIVLDVPEITNFEVENLTLVHKEYGAKNATTTDISKSGKIVTCYPSNIFTFYMNAEGFDDVADRLNIKCGGATIPFVKSGEQFIAQGYISNPTQLVQVCIDKDSVFETEVKWIIDPSGYLYETSEDDRVEGATVSIYYSDNKNGINAVKWDAKEYGQKNDLVTGSSGFFAWDVPEGYYRVVASKEGYETVKSGWMPVPPPQLDVNLKMKDKRSPKIKGVTMTADHMMIYFDKYMTDSYLTYEDLIRITSGEDVVEVESCSLVKPTQQGYSKSIRVDFKETIEEDGLDKVYKMEVNPEYGLYSYASVSMEAKDAVVEDIVIEGEVTGIEIDNGAAVTIGKMIDVDVKLLSDDKKIDKRILATVTDESVAEVVSVSEPDENGVVKVRLASKGLGDTMICLAVDGTNIEAKLPVVCVINEIVKEEVNQVLDVKNPPAEIAVSENSDKDNDKKPEDSSKQDTTEVPKNFDNNVQKPEDSTVAQKPESPKKGEKVTVNKMKYKIVGEKTDGTGTVSFVGVTKKTITTVTIPGTVKINGYSYKVTTVADKALKGCSKLKKVTVGANVTKIGKEAFKNCKKLKSIKVKSSVLKKVGKNALKGVNGKCKIKVPKKKLAAYKKLLKKKGQGKGVKITK